MKRDPQLAVRMELVDVPRREARADPDELTGHGKVLYKYDETTDFELHKFLNQTDVDNNDISLFVEVHIIPLLKAGKTTRAGRTIESTSTSVGKR